MSYVPAAAGSVTLGAGATADLRGNLRSPLVSLDLGQAIQSLPAASEKWDNSPYSLQDAADFSEMTVG